MVFERAPQRPSVSVIVPFAGSDAELEWLLAALERLRLGSDDELIVADNRDGARAEQRGRVAIRAAAGIRTPAFARNRGAKSARGQWLVFIDADTIPAPSLLDGYFDPPPPSSTAVLAGAIRDISYGPPNLISRHAVGRDQMSQTWTMGRPLPFAQTANCAVLRSAFEQIGGFAQEARAGEDADLCFRLQSAGWKIEERPDALVEHCSRATVGALVVQLAHHGSGAAWTNRRFPGTFPPSSPVQLARRLAHSARECLGALLRSDSPAAGDALLDVLGALAFELGRLLPNTRGHHAWRAAAPGSRADR